MIESLNQKSAQSVEEFQRLYKPHFSDVKIEKVNQTKQIESLITQLQSERLEAKPIIDMSSTTSNIDDWLDDLISE